MTLKRMQIESFSNPRRGSFSPLVGVAASYWIYCRDIFQDEKSQSRNMVFSHAPGMGKRIAMFMGIIEARLKIKSKSCFGPTQYPKITRIKVSRFWRVSEMRWSFFTMMLRAAMGYRPNRSFEKTLFGIRYTRATKRAILRFLKGNTKYRGIWYGGWVESFGESYEGANADIDSLVKP